MHVYEQACFCGTAPDSVTMVVCDICWQNDYGETRTDTLLKEKKTVQAGHACETTEQDS